MKAEYFGKRAALHSVVEASLMDEEGKRAARLLLDGFFAALAD